MTECVSASWETLGLILIAAKEEEGDEEGGGRDGRERTQTRRQPKFFKTICSDLAELLFVRLYLSSLPLILLFLPLNQNSLSFCLPCSRNEDPNRYPSVIWEAQCRHQRCVNAQGKLEHHMNSVLLQQEILVLRREPESCPFSFRVDKMLVGVGCTCVSSIVRHVA